MTERVFRPAGLLATRTTTTSEPVPNRAAGYSDNDRLVDAADWPAVRPGGAFLSTARDLARWDAVLYGNSILTEASRRDMWTTMPLADGRRALYGLGWHVNRPGARREVWHSGGLPGFKSQPAPVSRRPDHRHRPHEPRRRRRRGDCLRDRRTASAGSRLALIRPRLVTPPEPRRWRGAGRRRRRRGPARVPSDRCNTGGPRTGTWCRSRSAGADTSTAPRSGRGRW